MRVSDADRNGTLRRLHNAVALGLIDIGEFEERSAQGFTGPSAGGPRSAGRGSAAGRGHRLLVRRPPRLRGWMGSLRRHGKVDGAHRLSLVRRVGSVRLDLTNARFAGRWW